MHDAWASYDTYAAPDHQLCCAHALRELQAVTDAAAGDRWCWATQAAEALTAMQALVAEAINQGRHAVDPAALAAQIHLYHSAALAGASQTAARSGTLMKSTTRWPAACSTARTTTCGSPRTGGRPLITTAASAIYA